MAFSRLSLIILTTYLLTPILASNSTELCDSLGWSPSKSFNPWFRAWTNLTSGPGGDDPDYVDNMACWWYVDCIFSLVPEIRKQQYGAISYGLLAVMEVYSKRSSLGCPVPVFVVLWFIVALVPAAVEVAIGRFRSRSRSGKESPYAPGFTAQAPEQNLDSATKM